MSGLHLSISFFWLIGNGAVFFILLSTCSLLICRCSIDLCVLILYYESNEVISSSRVFFFFFIRNSSFCVESLEFSMKTIISTANKDSFISSFLICMPLISFYDLIALVRISSTMSNKSCETDILSLFLILEGKNIVFQH